MVDTSVIVIIFILIFILVIVRLVIIELNLNILEHLGEVFLGLQGAKGVLAHFQVPLLPHTDEPWVVLEEESEPSPHAFGAGDDVFAAVIVGRPLDDDETVLEVTSGKDLAPHLLWVLHQGDALLTELLVGHEVLANCHDRVDWRKNGLVTYYKYIDNRQHTC